MMFACLDFPMLKCTAHTGTHSAMVSHYVCVWLHGNKLFIQISCKNVPCITWSLSKCSQWYEDERAQGINVQAKGFFVCLCHLTSYSTFSSRHSNIYQCKSQVTGILFIWQITLMMVAVELRTFTVILIWCKTICFLRCRTIKNSKY